MRRTSSATLRARVCAWRARRVSFLFEHELAHVRPPGHCNILAALVGCCFSNTGHLRAAAMARPLFLSFQSLHPRRNVLVILCLFLTVGCLVTPLLAQRGEQAIPRQVQI